VVLTARLPRPPFRFSTSQRAAAAVTCGSKSRPKSEPKIDASKLATIGGMAAAGSSQRIAARHLSTPTRLLSMRMIVTAA